MTKMMYPRTLKSAAPFVRICRRENPLKQEASMLELPLIFVGGFLGLADCVGMCGGFAR